MVCPPGLEPGPGASEAHNRMKYINFLNILSDFIDNFF